MAQIKPGGRFKSAVCDTEVMVVLAPKTQVELTCGGVPMLEIGATRPGGLSIASDAEGGTLLGKRYVNKDGDLEVLCTKPGKGSLGASGAPLEVKEAKPLPSSD